MTVENEKDVQGLMAIGKIVGQALKVMLDAVRPGISTAELDEIGAKFLAKHGARSAPQVMYNFPGVTCISINDEAAHGIPGDRVVQAGDLVNVDVSAELNGYFADTGASIPVPPIAEETQRLCNYTMAALNRALDSVSAGKPLNTIGRAVEIEAKNGGYNIIRELGGHGIGRRLHEEPRNVPNYYTKRASNLMPDGLVLTIEPFLTRGPGRIRTMQDGWTLKTPNGHWAAQYEHTIIITKSKPIILTAV